LKNGPAGSVPDPVEKRLDGLGATVPENQPFVVDEARVEANIRTIGNCCKKTLYVAHHY
jgi:hypothetical protein